MLDIIGQLLKAKSDVESGKTPQVTISLDLNDPRAQKLSELAKKLMLPTTKIHTSGLITSTGMPIPERTGEFIEALRKEFGDELVGSLIGDLNAQMLVKRTNEITEMASSTDALANIATTLIGDPETRRNLSGKQRELFGNISSNLEQILNKE